MPRPDTMFGRSGQALGQGRKVNKQASKPGARLADDIANDLTEGGNSGTMRGRIRCDMGGSETGPHVQAQARTESMQADDSDQTTQPRQVDSGTLFLTPQNDEDIQTVEDDTEPEEAGEQEDEDEDDVPAETRATYRMSHINIHCDQVEVLEKVKAEYGCRLRLLASMCRKLDNPDLLNIYVGIKGRIQICRSFHDVHKINAESTMKTNKKASNLHRDLIQGLKSTKFGDMDEQEALSHVIYRNKACEHHTKINEINEWCQKLQKDLKFMYDKNRALYLLRLSDD